MVDNEYGIPDDAKSFVTPPEPEVIQHRSSTEVSKGMEDEVVERRERIPAREGFVLKENFRRLQPGDFTSSTVDASVPAELLTPVVSEASSDLNTVEKGQPLEMKEISTMGKSAFIERPTVIDGIHYNFLQWKGVGRNAVNRGMPENPEIGDGNMSYPVGEKHQFPLFSLQVKGKNMLRFQGGEKYRWLMYEAEQSKRFAPTGLRMPKIITTMKFSPEYCQANDLPIPENDNPDDLGGQGMQEYVLAHQEQIDPKLLPTLLETEGLRNIKTPGTILGESIRAFRNVWRVADVEKILLTPVSAERDERLKLILDSSKQILSDEVGHELSAKEFLEIYSELLGNQAATLINHRINQGAMKNHKQDVTLAAELCDYVGAYTLDDPYVANLTPAWVQDASTEQEWKEELESRVDRQIFLLAAHLQPVIEATAHVEGGEVETTAVVDRFVHALQERLFPEQRVRLQKVIREKTDLANIQSIAGQDQMTVDNLSKSESIFSRIVARLQSEDSETPQARPR